MTVALDTPGSGKDFTDGSWGPFVTSNSFSYNIGSASAYLAVALYLFGSGASDPSSSVNINGSISLASRQYITTPTNLDGLSIWDVASASLPTGVQTINYSLSSPFILTGASYQAIAIDLIGNGTVTVANTATGTGTAVAVNGGAIPAGGVMVGFAVHHYTFSVWTSGNTPGMIIRSTQGASSQNGRALMASYDTSSGSMTWTTDNSSDWAAVALSIAAGGPSVSVQPANATVNEFSAASFSLTAAASGGGSLSYQWKYAGLDGVFHNVSLGSGGTSASFTTGNTNNNEAQSGFTYKCTVTETGGTNPGSVDSSTVTLTVTLEGRITSPDYTNFPKNEIALRAQGLI